MTTGSKSFDSFLGSAISYSKDICEECPAYFPPEGYVVQKEFFAALNTIFTQIYCFLR